MSVNVGEAGRAVHPLSSFRLVGGSSFVSRFRALADAGCVTLCSTGTGLEMILPGNAFAKRFREWASPIDEADVSGVMVTVAADAERSGDELLVVLESGRVPADSLAENSSRGATVDSEWRVKKGKGGSRAWEMRSGLA